MTNFASVNFRSQARIKEEESHYKKTVQLYTLFFAAITSVMKLSGTNIVRIGTKGHIFGQTDISHTGH